MSPLAIVSVLLALSVLANGWQYHQSMEAATAAGAMAQSRDEWKSDAEVCGKSLEDLQAAGDRMAKANKARRDEADAKAWELARAADKELSTPASIAGDDCGSARGRVDRYLDTRTAR